MQLLPEEDGRDKEIQGFSGEEGELLPKKVSNIDKHFGNYTLEPSNANLGHVLKSLDPVINSSLASIGEAGNSFLRSKAKLYAAQAVKSYSPESGASLHTWVANQLFRLRRAKRESNSPAKVPERTQLDAYHIFSKEREFQDLHNREPDIHELSDYAKMPVKRIAKVRAQFFRVPTAEAVGGIDGITDAESDYMDEAISYLYDDLDHVDKKILEHRTGYGGSPILSNGDLARKLDVRPDVISKRSARLGSKIMEVNERLRRTNS